MRLDIDCVRDVLMAVEQKGFGQSYTQNLSLIMLLQIMKLHQVHQLAIRST